MDKPKVIVICGPTASGKTSLSIALAKQIEGEIISCDSMQIYKYMDIGSAKPTKEEMDGVPHYLVDYVFPDERYNVARYKKDAEAAIKKILDKGKTPIIVGGTGLYVNSLIYGIEYPEIELDEEYRKILENKVQEEGLKNLYKEAEKIDPEAMQIISVNDRKRILRVLEIYHATGKTKTQQEKESRKGGIKYDYKLFAIDWPREELYERINFRVDQMIKQGLVKEVENLIKKYPHSPTAMQALGYKEIKEYLDGEITIEESIDKIKQETRRYAKRQLTWFRKNKPIWLDGKNTIQNNINIILEGTKWEKRRKIILIK